MTVQLRPSAETEYYAESVCPRPALHYNMSLDAIRLKNIPKFGRNCPEYKFIEEIPKCEIYYSINTTKLILSLIPNFFIFYVCLKYYKIKILTYNTV